MLVVPEKNDSIAIRAHHFEQHLLLVLCANHFSINTRHLPLHTLHKQNSSRFHASEIIERKPHMNWECELIRGIRINDISPYSTLHWRHKPLVMMIKSLRRSSWFPQNMKFLARSIWSSIEFDRMPFVIVSMNKMTVNNLPKILFFPSQYFPRTLHSAIYALLLLPGYLLGWCVHNNCETLRWAIVVKDIVILRLLHSWDSRHIAGGKE